VRTNWFPQLPLPGGSERVLALRDVNHSAIFPFEALDHVSFEQVRDSKALPRETTSMLVPTTAGLVVRHRVHATEMISYDLPAALKRR
jgi:hypothetical protein